MVYCVSGEAAAQVFPRVSASSKNQKGKTLRNLLSKP